MAVAAANALERGADLAGAVAAAQAMRENLKIIVMVDTLEYLRRGGRIGAAQAWIGATLKVKPILTIEGEMQPVERVRTACRAFERLVAHLEQRREDGCDGFAVQHVQALAEAERLAERGREIYGRDPELISEIGPVIGTHTGPGHPRRHRPAHGTARPASEGFRRAGWNTPAVGVPLDPPQPQRTAARPGHPVLVAADHRAHARSSRSRSRSRCTWSTCCASRSAGC